MATWLITGANRGIGLALARHLSRRGERVIGTARAPGRAGDLRATGAQVEQLDVTNRNSVAALGRALDGVALDVLVNNAGRGGGGPGIDDLDLDIVSDYFQVNSVGPLRVTQAALPSLRRGQGKRIIGITSKLGSIEGVRSGGHYAYRASKAALNMFYRCLAVELGAEGFVCTVLHPGWVKTEIGGGDKAALTPDQSASDLIERIDRLGPDDNGCFYSHDGEQLPW